MEMDSRKMISGISRVMAAGLLLTSLVANTSAQTVHYFSTGERACANGRLDSTSIDLCVYTNRTTNQAGKQPLDHMLYFYAYGPNGTSVGYGKIPASALEISTKSATLNFNAVSSEDFYQWGPLSGAISLSWYVDGVSVSRSHNNSQQIFSGGDIRVISNGEYDIASATATRTMFGYTLESTYGTIGITRNMKIMIEK
jgi:hypothetical protein